MRKIERNITPLCSFYKFTAGANPNPLQRGVNSLLKNTFGWLQKVYYLKVHGLKRKEKEKARQARGDSAGVSGVESLMADKKVKKRGMKDKHKSKQGKKAR